MKKALTREYIDTIAPEHGRTSCTDMNRTNGYYKIKEESLRGVVIKRGFEVHPRCTRCFLLDALVTPLDAAIDIRLDVHIGLEQPQFEIKAI